MIVYKCIVSGDEIFTDSFGFVEENGCYKLKAKYVTKKADDVDSAALGANPSCEEAEEETESSTESGLDIVMASRLVETGFDKKSYKEYLKLFSAAVVAKMKENGNPQSEIDAAKAEMQEAVKFILGKFKDWCFYTGESMDPSGLTALVDWVDEEEDGKPVSTPYFYAMKCGIISYKY